MKKSCLRSLLTLWFLLCFCAAPPLQAQMPAITRLLSRPLTDPADSRFGSSVALSSRWILIGEPANDDRGGNAGSASVFDAGTNRLVRRLYSPTAQEDGDFGLEVAICGDFGLVSAPGEGDGLGAVFLFDLRNGRLIARLENPDGEAAVGFGEAIALSDRYAAVSAPDQNGSGIVHVYEGQTGAFLFQIRAEDGDHRDEFGASIALMGDLALVGAPQDDQLFPNAGAAYVFNLISQKQSEKIFPQDGGAANGLFGWTVAMAGDRVAIGSPFDENGKGAVDLFQLRGMVPIQRLQPPGTGFASWFGMGLALDGNLLIVGAPLERTGVGAVHAFRADKGSYLYSLPRHPRGAGSNLALLGDRAIIGESTDDTLGNGAGAAYVYSGLSAPMPLQSGPVVGDYVPGQDGSVFTSFYQATILNGSGIAFLARQTAPRGSRRVGASYWSLYDEGNEPRREFGPGVSLNHHGGALQGVTVSGLAEALTSPITGYGYLARLSGTGVTRRSDLLVVYDDGLGNSTPLLRTGTAIGDLQNAEVGAVLQMVVSPEAIAFPIAYRLNRGVAGVTLGSDSGIVTPSYDFVEPSFGDTALREGGGGPGFGIYRQFAPRVAVGRAGGLAYSAMLDDGVAARSCLFNSKSGIVARQGDAPTQPVTTARFQTFVGESYSRVTEHVVYRATLSGGDANAGNNEGIWHQNPQIGLVARKGSQHPTEAAGQLWHRFLAFWPVGDRSVTVMARLRGPGVTSGNDCGLWHLQEDGTWIRLLREGQALDGPECVRVGALIRAEVDPYQGRYWVLCSLTGNRAANLAQLSGHARVGIPDVDGPLRRPWVGLRKGTLVNGADTPGSRLRSLNLFSSVDRAGAGSKGLGQSIDASGRIVATLTYDRGISELRYGNP
ncbi:MAG: hypothetical protein JNK37_17550 [Verrucomicrobiales bacterium]|nr:hypothetical protein [Verrucomicrobiales bacterium]